MVTRRPGDAEHIEHARDLLTVDREGDATTAELREHTVDELTEQPLGRRDR